MRKDEYGRMVRCDYMEEGRSCIGLGGARNTLIAAGGERFNSAVSDVEAYNTKTNKWSEFPSLVRKRKWAGVYCLFDYISNSLDIFCFCGDNNR